MSVVQAGALVASLMAGLSQVVTCRVFQDGFPYSDYTDTTIASAAAANSNSITKAGGGTAVVGQLLSIVKGSTRYLHMVTEVSGETLTILPSLKTAMAGGETVELAEPNIEGFIEGQEQSFDIGMVSNVGLSFKINEAN